MVQKAWDEAAAGCSVGAIDYRVRCGDRVLALLAADTAERCGGADRERGRGALLAALDGEISELGNKHCT